MSVRHLLFGPNIRHKSCEGVEGSGPSIRYYSLVSVFYASNKTTFSKGRLQKPESQKSSVRGYPPFTIIFSVSF